MFDKLANSKSCQEYVSASVSDLGGLIEWGKGRSRDTLKYFICRHMTRPHSLEEHCVELNLIFYLWVS